MKSLIIKDLVVAAELDGKAMASVHGGTGKSMYASYCAPTGVPYGDKPYVDVSKFSFDATQSLAQSQNTLVNNGNNVAFADNITANVNPTQNGTNNINFG